MRKLLNLFLFIICSMTATAQTSQDSIIVDYSFWGNSYAIKGVEVPRSDIVDILENNINSSDRLVSSSWNKNLGYIALGAGLLLTINQIKEVYMDNTYSGGTNKSSGFVISSALALGLDLTGLLLIRQSNKQFQSAIKIYNRKLSDTSQNFEFNIGFDFNKLVFSLSI